MKSILIPHKYKKLGWYLLLPSFLGGIILLLSNFESPIDWKINVFAICYVSAPPIPSCPFPLDA